MNKIKKVLQQKNFIRAIEAHDGISATLIENAEHIDNKGNNDKFDALWSSSLCDSLVFGRPDMEVVDISKRLEVVSTIREISPKPIIFDIDSGGNLEQLYYKISDLNKFHIEAIIMEDKIGSKRNSLYGSANTQKQDSLENFKNKIEFAKNHKNSDMLVFARVESLSLGKSKEDAIERGKAYINAGADGLLVHSVVKESDLLLETIKDLKEYKSNIPIAVVPSAFPQIKEEELRANGVNIIIYANQLIRSTFTPMREVLNKILTNHRSLEAEEKMASINEVLDFINHPNL